MMRMSDLEQAKGRFVEAFLCMNAGTGIH
jgi:hypothetical protein